MQELLLSVENLSVAVEKKEVLSNCSFVLNSGATYMLMGSNGAGKSSLVAAIMGHSEFRLVAGLIKLCGENLSSLPMYERVRKGFFWGMQHPPVIDGITLRELLRVTTTSCVDRNRIAVSVKNHSVEHYVDLLQISEKILQSSMNKGCSGGERKKNELLQLLLMQNPVCAILDEIDAGLDVDALLLVRQVIDVVRKRNPQFTVLFITHTTRLCSIMPIDEVYVMSRGTIVAHGNELLAYDIEQHGYKQFEKT